MLIEPKYCIRRAESYELLHDEIGRGAEISIFEKFRGQFPLPAPLKFELNHCLSNQVVPFAELNLLNYYMT